MPQYNSGRQRNVFVDALRGIAMFLVLWGHSIQFFCAGEFDFFENPVFRFIYSFHMPLFILISGYSFYWSCKKDLKTILKKQLAGLGIVLLVWNSVQWAFSLLHTAYYGRKLSVWYCVKQWITNMCGLWFLWSILIFSVAVAILYKKTKGPKSFGGGYLLIWIVMCILPGQIEPAKPYNIWLFPYFLTGFLFHAYRDKIHSRWLSLRYISLPVFPVLLHFFHRRDYIYTSEINPFSSEYGIMGQIGIDIFRWIIGLVGSVFVITILLFLYKNVMGESCKVWSFWGNIGQYTMQIYVMQSFVLSTIINLLYIKVTSDIGYNILAQNMVLYNFVWTPLISALLMAVFTTVAECVGKKPKLSKMLFGR